MATPRKPSPVGLNFGRFVQQLRKDRGLTQEQLAEHSGLAADTIRRLERGTFSPSLDTLTKLTVGLRIDLEVLFTGFVRGETATGLELLALTRTLSQNERAAGLRILIVLVALLGNVKENDRGGRRDA
jgi:transcriptional regulator with XRE-family HTH domain